VDPPRFGLDRQPVATGLRLAIDRRPNRATASAIGSSPSTPHAPSLADPADHPRPPRTSYRSPSEMVASGTKFTHGHPPRPNFVPLAVRNGGLRYEVPHRATVTAC
jgi:hypothetical protein